MRKIKRGELFDASYAVDLRTCSEAEIKEIFDSETNSWNERLENCPNIFVAAKGGYREFCEEIVKNGEKGNHKVSGTMESFAQVVLKYFMLVDGAIQEGDAASATRFALVQAKNLN